MFKQQVVTSLLLALSPPSSTLGGGPREVSEAEHRVGTPFQVYRERKGEDVYSVLWAVSMKLHIPPRSAFFFF